VAPFLESELPLGQVSKIRNMTPQFKPAAYKNVESERQLVSACPRLSGRALTLRDGDRKQRFVIGAPALAAMIAFAFFLTTSAIAQERQHAYSEYTYWFNGAFENGHAFSSTVGARNYQLETRYERLIYWKEPFAVRWVFEVVPVALVGDRYTSTGHRAYSYGVGGSPIGAQVNFVHYRHVEPFLTSGGGFLYFNHRMFGTSQQFNFTAQLGGGVQLFTSSRRTAIDLGYKYHHISNANLGNQNPGLDSHMLFVGLSLFR
jgi:Lipid A 3-O-deacylase (PagL)